MLNYFLFMTTSFLFYFSYKFLNNDGYNKLMIKYEKWKSLKDLVSTQHKSRMIINLISFSMVLKSFYLSFIQYMNNSIIKVGKNKYELTYIINGKMYKILVKPARGPVPILCVTDKNNNDITEKIIPYLGPNNDWHNEKYYPDFFNEEVLTFELLNGDKKIFRHSETIII